MTALPGLPTITVKGPFWSAALDVISVTTPLAYGQPVLLTTDFEALGPRQDPPHWIDTKADSSFVVDDKLFRTARHAGSIVFGTNSTEANIHSHYAVPGVLQWTNYTFTGRLRKTHANGSVGVTFLSHFSAGRDDYYRLRTLRNQPNFHLSPHRQGQGSVEWPHADSGVAAQPNVWYRFHIEVQDQGAHTAIRVKIWAEGEPEPATYQIDVIDDSPEHLRTGGIGMWAAHAGAKYIDDLRVIATGGSGALQPRSAPLFAEDFAGYSGDKDPAGWIDTAAGNSTEQDDSQFKTSRLGGQMAFGCETKDDNVHSHVAAPQAAHWTNYAYSGRMYVDGVSVGVTFFSSYPTAGRDDYYRLRAHKATKTFHIAPHPHGKRTVRKEGSDSGIRPKGKTWYRFYIEVEDDGARTNIRAKVWEEGTAEPAAFQIDTYDDAPDRLRAGTVGLWSDRDGESYYDDLRVQPLAPTASALRMLYLDQMPRTALGEEAVLLPGTLIALCAPKTVTIRPTDDNNPSYRWTQNTPLLWQNRSLAELRALLGTGDLSLLLLQIDPATWPPKQGNLPDFTCIAGEINLDRLTPRAHDDQALYQALALERAERGERPHGMELHGNLTVHSSGATIYGSVYLPWLRAGEQVAAPFQLARAIAPDATGNAVLQPRYRLSIERERLTKTEEAAWIRVWRALSILVNPRNPLHGRDGQGAVTTIWSTLEIANPLRVPNLFWQMDEWGAVAELYATAGEINLLLSDRHPYSQETPPTSLATVASTADIPLTPSADGKTLILTLTAGPFPTPLADGVTYTADLATQHEQIVFPPMALAFDPVETPRFLRSTLNRPTPETIDEPGNNFAQEPLVWGFAPLSDGWAQLPVPNMTEQLYFQSLDERHSALLATDFATLTAGQDPPGWTDTKADSSFDVDDQLFKTMDYESTVVFGTDRADANIHSHYNDPAALEWSNYAFTGRMLMQEQSGIGVTFLSQHPNGRDDYYRLRTIRGKTTFHISPHRHGQGSIPWNHADSGIEAKPNRWYRFRIEVRDQDTSTAIRAKIWEDSSSEPTDFHIDVIDNSEKRLRKGTVGIWAAFAGAKYVDDLTVIPLENPSVFQGAVAFGNSYNATLAAYPAEQAWNLTLTGAQAVQGQWRLARETETDPFVLTRVRVQIVDAEVTANGFFWLSTATPTAADALPDLSNWVTGLHQLPLRSVRRTPDALPPIIQVSFDAFTISLRDFQPDAFASPSAHLGSWAFTYHIANAAIATAGKAGAFITAAIRAHPPLLWRRHPTLPTIQALPLTQTLTPPNMPIASRQLAPYQLAKTPMAWRFGVTPQLAGAFSAATQWPQAQSDFAPAEEWLEQHDLPMVALTLPGLYFDPDGDLLPSGLSDATETHLSIRYRYDLPYTDELNALAQTPKTPRDPNEVSPLPDATPPKPAQPLTRTTLLNHWTRLAEQASLASVAAADAIILHNEQVTVQRLIEPLYWPVAATINLSSYPGFLELDNTDVAQSAPLHMTGHAALEGISGRFVDDNDNVTFIRRTAAPTDVGYAVRAGTMQSHVSSAGLRDQRGLVRALSRHDEQNSRLIFTEVTLHGDLKGDATAVQQYRLLSLTEALLLDVPGSTDWHFWIKDLPAAAVDAPEDQHYHFNRTRVLSPLLKELDDVDPAAHTIVAVNDPEAVAREQNYRMGYEWRLGDGTTGTNDSVQPLLLNGLRFFPLTLEDVTVVAGEVTQLALVGRLQLPLQDDAELADLNNAVRLIFTRPAQPGPAALALTDIQVESPVVEWPLQLAAGEQTNAPRIEWRTIRLDAEQIVIGNADVTAADATRCRFVLFGQEWSVPLGELVFSGATDPVAKAAYDFNQNTEIRTIIPQRLAVALSLTDGEHSATLDLLIRAGINKQPSLQATVQFMLVGPAGSSIAPVTLIAATLFDRLLIDTADQPIQYVPEALQFVWQGCMTDDIDGALQFLPGMRLQPATCPGFLALTFVAQSPSATANGIRIPPLRLTSAFTETLLAAQWGVFRQRQPGEAVAAAEQAQQLFGSSAGEIFIGYTAQWMATDEEPDLDGGRWSESFLLNGFLEVTNLISWPAHMRFDEAAKQLTLPAIATDGALAHLRHTIRILLNQHDLPAHLLMHAERAADTVPVLFTLSSEEAWQFLAVVEHQLLEVHLAAPTDAGDEQPVPTPTATYPWEHRWTALQEVRLLAPSRYSAFLADDGTQVIDPVAGIAPRWTLYGHYQSSWVKRLTDASSPDALQHLAAGVILVEASAPHWLRTKSVETLLAETMQETTGNTSTAAIVLPTLSGTTLQFLPNGSQAAILSGLDDFGPSAPIAPEWQLLTMPFLGRLQDLQLDGIRTTPVGEPMTADATAKTVHPLHVDPLLQLWRLVQGTSQSISPLVPMLSSWALETELVLAFSELEHPVGRTWSRLDPLSLEENWFRLQNPPAEPPVTRLASIMAALPDTPARLSRATALAKAFDAFRAFYPPPRVVATAEMVQPNAARRAAAATKAALLWREESILVWQVGVRNPSENAFVYPWLPVGIQIGAGALRAPSTAVQHHHAAATLLPARLQSNGKANPTPVSFAVSPYLGLAHHPAPGDATLFLASLELLGLDAASAALRPIASQLYEESDEEALQRWAAKWAAETRQRLRPDSPLGIIRLRQLLSGKRTAIGDSSSTEEAIELSSPSIVRLSPLVATYNFVLIEQEMLPSALTQRVVALRSPIRELRFREGQYGGSIMPQAIMPYEIAPPLTTGVQAVYLIPPENGATEPAATAAWPWGISALTVGVQYTGSKPGDDGQGTKIGITGKAPVPFSTADPMSALPYTLWWHAPHHQIQFRSAIADIGPVAGLPPFFRAQAIKSLLPALAQLPFPSAAALEASDNEEALTQWQPVLPGALRYLLIGARPGAMLAIRNQLWRQRGLAFDGDSNGSNNGETVIPPETLGSGSIPVQHRVPRPTPLPANRPGQEEYALQPWASYRTPTQNVLATSAPADEALFAQCGSDPLRRLQMRMTEPTEGSINRQWSGLVQFELRNEEDEIFQGSAWDIRVEVVDNTVLVPLENVDQTMVDRTTYRADTPTLVNLRQLIGRKRAGDVIFVQAHVRPLERKSTFRQTLTFPLHIINEQQLRLPLAPRFTLFEDPQYNRRLASLAGRVTQNVQVNKAAANQSPELVLQSVALVTDRREYNPDSVVALRYDWDDESLQESSVARVSFQRVDRNNTPFALQIPLDLDQPNNPRFGALKTGATTLLRFNLADFVPVDPKQPTAFRPGETLQITLRFEQNRNPALLEPVVLTLNVNIVAEPVIPMPEAAYALLRHQEMAGQTAVECVRFAWGPEASRIDLICPDDLTQEIVRRRAVFKWQDSVRLNGVPRYGVQKVAQNGATHFLAFD